MKFELKSLSPEAIPSALDKAVRYRLLNEPVQAESICRDILAIDADNQKAMINLLLALTDQFETRLAVAFEQAQAIVPKLDTEYHRSYYGGIICERRADAHLTRSTPSSGHLAYDWYRQAMEKYESAVAMRPAGNDDAVLRWNTCVRIMERHPEIKPVEEDQFHPLLE